MGEQAAGKPKAREVMKKLTKDYYEGALRAREEGRFVAYTKAISPVELFYAHDIIPIYPENHAVMCLTGRMMPKLSLEIEKRGYTTHLCAYARSDLGYRELGESPIGGIPDPHFLLSCNAQCFTLTKWFQVLSRRYGIPVFVFDTPQYIREGEARKNIITYGQHQLAELIEALEDLTGEKVRLRPPEGGNRILSRGQQALQGVSRSCLHKTLSHQYLRRPYPHGHYRLPQGNKGGGGLLSAPHRGD